MKNNSKNIKKRSKQDTKKKKQKLISHEDEEPIIRQKDEEIFEDYNENLLSQAKAQWFFGEWESLAELDLNIIRKHPDKAILAILLSSAYQQLGQHNSAKKYVRLSRKWGCDKRLLSQILIAGVHNTLGRIAALCCDENKILEYFDASVNLIGISNEEVKLFRQSRSVREMTRLGLIPQAATLLEKEVHNTKIFAERPEYTTARLDTLKVEMDLLTGALSLAQKRHQLYKNSNDNISSGSESKKDSSYQDLSNKSFSQIGQDLWVLEMTNYKREGFFVEFGASDGILLSNTYLLETEFDWKGICAEPNPRFFEKLNENRRCIRSNACIAGETDEEVQFLLAAEFGTITRYIDSDEHSEKRKAYALTEDIIILKTISLNDFLCKYNAPKNIDYLTIDTEGSEYEILENFPMKDWNIRLITIEHNFTQQRDKIYNYLRSYGYERKEAQWDDWYYMPEEFSC